MNDVFRRDPSGGFSPVTEDNRAGQLWIITILCTIYSGFAAAVRLRIKWSLLGFDDIFTIAGFLFQIAQAVVLFKALQHGLGQVRFSLSTDELAVVSRYLLASQAITIAAICCAKLSIIYLLLRLFSVNVKRNKSACVGLLSLACLWGAGSLIGLLVNCDPSGLLSANHTVTCPSQFMRWQFVSGLDIATEILIVMLPIWLSWSLHMSRKRKGQFVFAFAFRLGSIALTGFHLGYFQAYLGSERPILDITDALLFQQVMIAYTLISATIPNMKAFMKSFSTGLGWQNDMEGSASSRYATNSRSHSYPLQSLRSGTHPRIVNEITANRGDDSSDATGDRNGSQEMIITKNVEWTVTHSTGTD